MKISKILTSVSALAIAASMAIPASAGNGAPIGYPDGWMSGNAKDTLVSRFIIGTVEDGSLMENTNEAWDKMFEVTTIRVTIQGDYFGEEGWAASGSFVLNQNYWGWAQVDWALGSAIYNLNDDGTIKEVNPEKNTSITNIYVTDNKYTLEISGADFCKAEGVALETVTDNFLEFMRVARDSEGVDLTKDFLSLSVQCFNEDETKSWNVLGYEMLDANGNQVIGEGEVAMGDLFDPAAAIAGDSSTGDDASSNTDSKADDTSKDDTKADNSTASDKSTSTGSNTTSTGKTSSTSTSSDKSADTGAASGLALAGIALAGAAFVISKKK